MAQDPVCRMQVEESKAAARAEYKGKTYDLCSFQCKDKFVSDPKQYVELLPKESQ